MVSVNMLSSLPIFESLCHTRSRCTTGYVIVGGGRLSRQFLLEGFLRNKVFVGLSFVPVLGSFFAEPEESKHSEQIVPESHKKGPDAKEGTAAGRLGFDGLDLQHQLPVGAFLQSVGGNRFDARPDPPAVHHALTSPALALAASILDILTGLGGNVSNGLAGPGHAGPGVVSLPKDHRNGPFKADPSVSQGSNIPGGICEGFFLDPFWHVGFVFLWALILLLPRLRSGGGKERRPYTGRQR